MAENDSKPTPSPKYQRWYDAIITRARNRQIDGYVERHHVLPKCMGGSNDDSNLVVLTYREHFLAHWLLVKFTKGQARRKMLHALLRMCFSNETKSIVAGWQYEIAKHAARDAMKGSKLSPEHVAKMSAAIKGRKLSPEACANMSAAHKGRKLSPEHVAKTSAALKGRKLSPEHIAKLKDRKISPEWRANMSAARKGKKMSPEHCAKMSAIQKGRKLSLEHRAKVSATMKGRKMSPEHRAKISAGLRAARAASLKQGELL